jgi:peptide/nickel transport system permease protein
MSNLPTSAAAAPAPTSTVATAAATTAPASAAAAAPASAIATAAAAPLLHDPHASRVGRGGTDNRRRTLATFLVTVLLLVAVVVVGRLLAGPNPFVVTPGEVGAAVTTDFTAKNLSPSASHPFGTDWMGRDMLARTLAGLSTSVFVGLFAAGASAVLALILGTIAALGGRRADALVTWLIDLMLGIPHIVLLILISFAIGRGFWGVAVGVALTHWPNLARVIRAEILQCRESVFVAQARKFGAGPLAIVRDHLFPHVFPQFLVGLVLLFPHAILHEAAITFLGFGLPPEQPAIGIILSESMTYLSAGYWWLALFPGIALIATVLLFDRAGSNLRRLIDPYRSQE